MFPSNTSGQVNPVQSTHTAAESNPSRINYLDRCVEDISQASLDHHRKVEILNKTVAVASSVVYVAAVVASIVLTAIFSPASLPITSISLFLFLDPVQNFIASRLLVAKTSNHARDVCLQMKTYYDQLSDDALTSNLLDQLQADTSSTPPSSLKGVLSHYLFWHERSSALVEQSKQKLAEQAAHKRDYPQEREFITQLQISQVALEEASLIAKVNAAFYLSILRNPDFSGSYSQTFSFGSSVEANDYHQDFTTLGRRALAERFNDNEQSAFVGIKTKSKLEAIFDIRSLSTATQSDLANLIGA